MPLSKHDISEYYSDSKVRDAILQQVRNRPVLTFISPPKGAIIARRFEAPGKPIHITQAKQDADSRKDLAYYTDRRYSEFHPVIGKKTNQLWVDIDPGSQKSTEDLKPLVSDVADVVEKMPAVRDVQIAYSGGRGFYVRGMLDRERYTNAVRKMLNRRLKQELRQKGVVFKPPKKNQVRLDTSTLHDKGSIRALHSINAETGRVSVPLSREELFHFDPETTSVRHILGQSEGAPGIPKSKRIHPLPDKAKEPKWTMSVQEHEAQRAGKHWDFRLVDPHTGFAHSWAVPKAQFPGTRPVLAIQTPTHTSNYALNFGKDKPQKIQEGYGAGTVKIKHQAPVNVVQSSKDKLKFERTDTSEMLTLFRTKDNKWLLKKGSTMHPLRNLGYCSALEKLGLAKTVMTDPSPTEAQQPLEVNDEELPAGELASILAKMDTPVQANPRNDNALTTDSKLNRETTWDSPRDIPSHFMTGATTPMPGAF